MFRKPGAKRSAAARQRKEPSSEEGSSNDEETKKEILSKRRRKNPMIQTTRKDNESKRPHGSSSSSSDDERVDDFAFKASGTSAPLGPRDMGATATLDIDTEKEQDARSQFERIQNTLEDNNEPDTDASGRPLYRGLAMYGAKKAQDTAAGTAGSGSNRLGPVRAPQFLRQTVRWDFAPDICKDYKETGFCTFGDSCKFMHDRGDYKHGWELERDFEQGQVHTETNYEISDDEDDLPHSCYICRGEFIDPVVTRCKHYFCEKCALTAFKKSKKCRVCEENTGGVFNIAKDLIAHLKGESSKKREVKEELTDSSDDGEVKMEDTERQDEGEEERYEENREIKEEVDEEEEEEEERGDVDVKEEDIDIENEVDGDEDEEDENVSDEEEYDEGEDTPKD